MTDTEKENDPEKKFKERMFAIMIYVFVGFVLTWEILLPPELLSKVLLFSVIYAAAGGLL